MAGQPTVTSSGVNFPPGTPWQVVNAYYAAVLRNQQIAAAQAQQPEPWEEWLGGFQKQVLNPYLNSWIQQPFQDYRSVFSTDQSIRQNQALADAQTAAKQQQLQDAYDQEQRAREAFGQATGSFLNEMQPRIGDVASDTGVTAPYGSYEDPQYTSPGPTFPDYNPYAGAVAPEAVAVEPPVPPGVASWQQNYEAGPSPMPSEPAPVTGPAPLTPAPPQAATEPPPFTGSPDTWMTQGISGVPSARQSAGKMVVNGRTGERWISNDGVTWSPVGQQTASTGGPAELGDLQTAVQGLIGSEAVAPPGTPAAAAPTPPVPMAPPAPVTPSAEVPPTVPTIAAPRSRLMGTTTVTPSFSDAMRTLAGIDPTAAGWMMQAVEKPGVLNALDPLRQEKLVAEILKLNKGAGLIGAQTDLTGATTEYRQQQTEALRVKNETIARVTDDFRSGRIGQEEWKIQMAAAYGKFGGAGAAQSNDTKTFGTALASVRIDPANSGKSESELRTLAAQWLQDQAQLIEDRKARGRAIGEFGAGMQPPPAAQIDKHGGYQQAAGQLGDIANLVPKVNLNRLVGGIQPWLTKIAAEGRVGGTFISPPFPIDEKLRMTLSPDEQRFIALTQDYADVVLRLRSGAQINEQEMVRMLDFLPTNQSTPEAFRAKLSTAFDSIDRWMTAFYRSSKDYGYKVPEDSRRQQAARRILKNATPPRAYDDASVRTFMQNNPSFPVE